MEKKPSLSEVIAHFDGAQTILSIFGTEGNYNSRKVFFDSSAFFTSEEESGKSLALWREEYGYAKILTYKNSNMKLSKEFIKANADKTLKEVFPEICVTVLEVGKWYKSQKGAIVFCEETDFKELIYGYGFTLYGYWCDSDKSPYQSNLWTEATHQEIQQALEKEATKRGFKKGAYVISLYSNGEYHYGNGDLLDKELEFKFENNILSVKGGADYYRLFVDGKWAKMSETITKQEAEEKLKCKIIE